jgi:hypothetical protein
MTEQYKFQNRAEYIKTLDSILPAEFEQKRDVGNSTHCYYPQAIKEAIADNMFHYWNVIDEKYQLLSNELVCTVKIAFMPGYQEADEQFCTGSAAVPVQMDAQSKPSDFPAKKKLNALEYNLPAVRSEAMSNALGTLGNIFGRNLNRKLNQTQKLQSTFTFRKHGKTD